MVAYNLHKSCCVLQSELAQWRTLFIFTACSHVTSSLCFVLLGASRRQRRPTTSTPRTPHSPAPPTHYEATPTNYEAPLTVGDGDEDSDAEYGSVIESMEAESENINATRPISRSPSADNDLHFGQLMESIL